MIKTIPEVNIYVCDFCKRENPARRTGFHLSVEQAALDYQGNPCANAGYKLDACDECAANINAQLSALIK